jgi:hypothetical protein
MLPPALSYKLMRTCHSWIQSHSHAEILKHLLNMVNSFLCSSTNYFENRLLPNDLLIIIFMKGSTSLSE